MTETKYQIPLDRTATTPVSEGIHPFVISEIEETESKVKEDGSGGNPMWIVTLSCLTEGEEGKEARMFLVLTPKARWKLEAFLDAVSAPATGSATADKFVGRKLRAQITHEAYEGKPQPRIGEMWPMSAARKPAPAVTPTVTKTAVAPKAGTPVPAAPVKPAAAKTPKPNVKVPTDVAGTDDDIPF